MNLESSVQDLTILLLVKGRDLHTLRWLWHANKIGLKYPILIADGGNNPISRKILSDPSLFPKIKYSYIQYNDASYLDYYKKVVDASERAKTEFVFRADNDDFILPSGLERAAEFMRANDDFVWCGSPMVQFSIHGPGDPAPNLTGDLYRLWLESRKDIYNSTDPMERLKAFVDYYSFQVYYAVYRRPHFEFLYQRITSLNPQNLDVTDVFKSMLSLLCGRHKVITNNIIYLHQTGTSQIHSTQAHLSHRLFHRDYMGDFNRSLAELTNHADPKDREKIDRDIRDMSARHMYDVMRHGEGIVHSGPIGRTLRKIKACRRARLAMDDRKLIKTLGAAGADNAYLSALTSDIAEVRQTLEGSEFINFLRAVAPEAFAQSTLS